MIARWRISEEGLQKIEEPPAFQPNSTFFLHTTKTFLTYLQMARSKKGRLSGIKRQEVLANRNAKILSGEVRDIAFARVRKHLGSGRVLAAIDTKHGPREIQAQIPNVFGRKGSTPINSTTVVTIIVGEEFDPDTDITSSSHFKVESILSDDQARTLSRKGLVPDWMLIIDPADAATAAAAAEDLYTCEASDDEEEDSDESKEAESNSASSSSSSKKKSKEPVKKEEVTFSRKAAKDAASSEGFNVDDI